MKHTLRYTFYTLCIIALCPIVQAQCSNQSFAPSIAIPDDSPAGVSVNLPVSLSGQLGLDYALDSVYLNLSHTYVGDLFVALINPAGDTSVLFDRPGVPGSTFGCGNDDVNANFNEYANTLAENVCNTAPALSGQIRSVDNFSQNGSLAGNWILWVVDLAGGDIGSVNVCTLYFTPLWYADNDQDGYGAGIGLRSCGQPQNYVPQYGDCNDANANIHPNAIEICANRIDEDCSGDDTDYLYQPVLSSQGMDGFCDGDSLLLLIQPFATGDSLVWFYNNNPIPFNTGNFLFAADSGNYTAAVIMTNGCYYPINTIHLTAFPSPTPSVSITENGLETSHYNQYTWYLNGQAISLANDAVWAPSENGIYQVEVVDSNGCSGISNPVQLNNASIVENEFENYTIYPNPASEAIYIDKTTDNSKQLVIYDSLGKLVHQQTITQGHTQVELNAFKSGIYCIKIGNNMQKLVISSTP